VTYLLQALPKVLFANKCVIMLKPVQD